MGDECATWFLVEMKTMSLIVLLIFLNVIYCKIKCGILFI